MPEPASLSRAALRALEEALSDTPVVALLGPRQCGKTTLARALAPKRAFISLDDHSTRESAAADPTGFLAGLPGTVTIDEIQRVPSLLLAIKRAVDEKRTAGRFLLTGSADLFLLPRVSESLAGRVETIRLHPFAECEKERSPGRFLAQFLGGELVPRVGGAPRARAAARTDLVRRVLQGGFPEAVARPPARARRWHQQYIESILERDVRDVASIRHGGELRSLVELCALRSATLLNASTLAGELGIDRSTVMVHLTVLERVFLLRRLPAWHTNACARLIKTPKLHLCDSGLCAALADLDEAAIGDSRDKLGGLLESWVVEQFAAQADWTDPAVRLHHFRDKDGVEVDLVLTRGRHVWGVEVKAAKSVQPSDFRGLSRVASLAGAAWRGGIVLYDGEDCLSMGSGMLAVPLAWLWSR
jgi:predicted AAA+ superfamily ATPase